MSDQRPEQEAQPAATGKGPAGTHFGAGTGVPGQQVDEENRETGDRDLQQTDHSGPAAEREGPAGEHTRAGAGSLS